MFSMLDQQLPELLHSLCSRLSRRYGAPGVRLADFPGRWLVYRTADLAAGLERAVIDAEPARHDTAEGLAEMESRAVFAAGEGQDATLVVLHLTRKMPSGNLQEAPSMPVLTLSAWSLEHPVALTGNIELDEAGTPLRIGRPDALLRS